MRAILIYELGMRALRLLVAAALVGFAHSFAHDDCPFSRRQSFWLVLAGIALIIHGVAGEVCPRVINTLKVVYFVDPLSESYPGASLMLVVIGMFLICLAVLFRYAKALYEDSDSIL